MKPPTDQPPPGRRWFRSGAERAADKAAAQVRRERALIERQRARDQRDVERIEAKQERRRVRQESANARAGKPRLIAGRSIEDVLTVVAASIATGVSAQGMWRFSGDVLGLDGPLRLLLFAFIEVAIITSAVRARRNMREKYSAGIDGLAVWALTCLTAVLSTMDARSAPEAVFRLAAPLVAAWLWERGMAIERHRVRGTSGINWRLTPERLLVRIGLAEATDRTAGQVDAHRRLTRIALAAKRVHQLRAENASDRKIRKAVTKRDRMLDQAVEHTGLAKDKQMQWALLDQVSTLGGAESLSDVLDTATGPWSLLDHPAITGAMRHSEAAQLAEETRRLSDAVLSARDPEAAAMIEMLAAMVTGQRVATPPADTPQRVSPGVADLVAGRVSLRPVPSPSSDTLNDTSGDTRSDTSKWVSEEVSPEVSDDEVDEIFARLRDEEGDTGDDTETATPSATEAMRKYWDAAIAQGRVPSGPELAKVGGCGDSYGRRMRREWLDALDGRTRRRLAGPKKATA
ncbi:hypothetical protein ACQP2T_63610 (plasmid) [Nonomuraea sp. CA-143628]|uniref:hypothetical protein n=1 Tax=Nonomuraea sp. CA-143628 TaxID=3239997 RepID=UPI003D93670A